MTTQKNLHQLHQRQRILQILLFSLITIVVWVAFELFRSQRSSSISAELKKAAQSINPNIDETVIAQLEQKEFFTPADLANFPIYKLVPSADGRSESKVTIDVSDDVYTKASPTPTPIPTVEPSPTPEAQLEETPIVTESGDITQ